MLRGTELKFCFDYWEYDNPVSKKWTWAQKHTSGLTLLAKMLGATQLWVA